MKVDYARMVERAKYHILHDGDLINCKEYDCQVTKLSIELFALATTGSARMPWVIGGVSDMGEEE